MNIFITSPSPAKSARFLDDKRAIKMILESAQMLSTALRGYGMDDNRLYKACHVNHPASIWCRQNRSNFNWLLAHFRALCEEYTKRYGKVHKSFGLYPIFVENAKIIPKGKRTDFANCAANKELNLDFKHLPIFEAYEKYLFARFESDTKPAVCKIGV